MAEAAITLALDCLVRFLAKETTSIFGFDDELESLKRELRAIKCFIKDADSRSKSDDDGIRGWVTDLRQVAYDIEDVLDTLDTQVGRYYTRNDAKEKVKRFFHKPKETVDQSKISSDIKRIKQEIRAIDDRRKVLDIKRVDEQGDPRRQKLLERRTREAQEEYQPNDLVGLGKEIEGLVDKLTDQSQSIRRVISVVGQAGVGKTALARKVYDRIKSRFWSCVWIHVSKHSSLQVLSELCKAVGVPEEEMRETDMLRKIARKLKEEKYLVVLDDVRTHEAWDAIRGAFPEGKMGSIVLMTTQHDGLAKYADPHTPPCKLNLLNQEDSHKVLCRHAFPRYPHSCPPELEELANVIVKKCAGLPRALVAAGGILSGRKPKPPAWKHFVEGFSWDLTKSSAEISSMLVLSFEDLRSELKTCLLYCCAFPGDCEIRVRRLLSLWIAEGFVEKQGDRQPEAVAMHYLDELVDRNLIQPCKWDSFGEIKSCRIHGVLREMLAEKAKEQNFFQTQPTLPKNYDLSKCRRLATYDHPEEKAYPLNLTRSFISFAESESSIRYDRLIQNFKLIKVLDLEGVRSVRTLPTEIGGLVLLRYLGLRHTSIETLPRSIKRLYNLQTLDLRTSRVRLSQSALTLHLKAKHVEKMTGLRHLYIGDRHCDAFYAMDASDDFGAKGKELRTLSYVKAGGWMERGLRTMSNIKKLGIQITDGDRSSSTNLTAISELSQLQNLCLQGRLEDVQADAFVNLTKLTLDSSCLRVDPFSRLQKLTSLKILKLLNNAYIGSTMSCSEGGFPCLEVLNLEKLEHLKDMEVADTGFSRLRCMRIAACIKLENIPRGLENVRSLQELILIDMGGRLVESIQPVRGKERNRIMHIQSTIISTSAAEREIHVNQLNRSITLWRN